MKKKTYVKMVWVERDIMSKVNSPFLIPLLYAFQSERELFLVMPFMRGGDLRYHLKARTSFNESTARFFAAEILMGLEALHLMHVSRAAGPHRVANERISAAASCQICFRDVKPENVLLDITGHARLSDFGVACELRAHNQYLTVGRSGTPGYMVCYRALRCALRCVALRSADFTLDRRRRSLI